MVRILAGLVLGMEHYWVVGLRSLCDQYHPSQDWSRVFSEECSRFRKKLFPSPESGSFGDRHRYVVILLQIRSSCCGFSGEIERG